jgi:hypothetical protein
MDGQAVRDESAIGAVGVLLVGTRGPRRSGRGADGLGEIAAGLVAQGLNILDSVTKGIAAQAEAVAAEEPTRPRRVE